MALTDLFLLKYIIFVIKIGPQAIFCPSSPNCIQNRLNLAFFLA